MKAQDSVKKYLNKRMRSLSSYLKKVGKRMDADDDDIHDLRVEIKKIRAVLGLINSASKAFKRREAQKPFDKIFKQAGIVRELQLEAAAAKKLKLSAVLKTYLQERARKLSKEKAKLEKYGGKRYNKKLVESYDWIVPQLKGLSKKKINSFIKKKKREIDKLKEQRSLTPSELHQLRKKLKEMQYIISIISSRKNKNGNQALQESLGVWHDKTVIETQLQRAMESVKLPEKEKVRLELAHHKVGVEAKRLYDEILNEKLAIS